jgi:hypothetical protein
VYCFNASQRKHSKQRTVKSLPVGPNGTAFLVSPQWPEHKSSSSTFHTEFYVVCILLVSFAWFQLRGVTCKTFSRRLTNIL